jgi:hypothetical protein
VAKEAATPATTTPAAVSVAECETFLGEIPSETTSGERSLLFDHFRRKWDGASSIVEIGPFLGGTTRAIAWGMLQHPRRSPDAVLHTVDRFDLYYSAELLRKTIEPLVVRGTFTKAQADDLCRTADFERLFNAIHAPHEYSRLVRLHNSPLPDRPEEIDGSTALGFLAGQSQLGALFIDGCKSWASTHYAMRYLLPRTRIGARVIFQDFGWYTCFWITSVVYALREFLQFESRADATYVFRLTRPVTAIDVANRFGRTPDEMGEAFFHTAAAALFEHSRRTGDLRGELISRLHLIAALATMEQKPAAARLLLETDARRYAPFASLIVGCLKSPTYRPGGQPITWTDVPPAVAGPRSPS